MNRLCRNTATAWAGRGHRRGAVCNHDDLHLGLHLEDVARRNGALRCSPDPTSKPRPEPNLLQDRGARGPVPVASAASGRRPHLGASRVRSGAGQTISGCHPTSRFENYALVFQNTPIAELHAEFVLGDDPHGGRRGGPVLHDRFALAIYKFPVEFDPVLHVRRGQLRGRSRS